MNEFLRVTKPGGLIYFSGKNTKSTILTMRQRMQQRLERVIKNILITLRVQVTLSKT